MTKRRFLWQKEGRAVDITFNCDTCEYTLFIGRQSKKDSGKYTQEITLDESEKLSEEDILYLTKSIKETPDGEEAYSMMIGWLLNNMRKIDIEEEEMNN